MPLPKRRLTSSQASSSQPSTASPSSAAAKPRPKKRARRGDGPDPHLHPHPDPDRPAPTAAAVAAAERERPAVPLPLPEPRKRVVHPGRLRRLTSGHPATTSNEVDRERARQTLSGNRVGGKSKDLKDGVATEAIWVSSAPNRFSAWLKRGVGAFVDRGCTCVKVHGMGAAIPTALSLALAIRDAVPGGSPVEADPDLEDDDDSEYDPVARTGTEEKPRGIIRLEVRTGTEVVGDEITPEDDDEDMIYQNRSKSTVEVTLRLDENVGKLVGVSKRFQLHRGGSTARGAKRRGGGGGGRGKRGTRGRGR